ncbi:hypothetical protein PoB_005604600 [Plakobranchus ocellatus]|uniref:Uncharacterized protein n=1 Tax=Plakobranchus ocellatus TaxID=259542 RepID=A0AAV4C9Z6_9GAST|nr:hypothetical protein PoB_005604600 [Plakobranchus ocellatus]
MVNVATVLWKPSTTYRQGREGQYSEKNYVSITDRLACYGLTTTYRVQNNSGIISFARMSLGLPLVAMMVE